MGQLIDGLSLAHNPHTAPKRTPINPELYAVNAANEQGTVVSRLQDGAVCFLWHKELQQSAVSSVKEKALKEWLGHTYAHACNVIQYEIRTRSLLCNDQLTLKVLLEYGRKTLSQMLTQEREGLDCSAVTRGSESFHFGTPLERMEFVKSLLDMAEEQRTKNGIWVSFHTKNLVYFPSEKTFKLFHLMNLDEPAFAESFFAPEEAGTEPTEHSCVFSMGMLLLSLFLGEDCSDCYNFQNFAFCESIFEDRIERLREGMVTRGLMGILDDESRYVPQFDEEISELILLMTAPKEERLCFAEVKRRYFALIRKASLSYAPSNNNRTHTHTRSILEPLTSKRAVRQRPKRRQNPNINCFSTNEELHFRTTITEAEESQFFALSKSNVNVSRVGNGGRVKDNQALQWKKTITNRMKQHKENMPYFQQQ